MRSHLILLSLFLCSRAAASTLPPPTGTASLTICAAASLNELLPVVRRSWQQNVDVDFKFEASSRLARQIEQGLRCDLFVSADEDWVDYLIRKSKGPASSKRLILTNRLVMIVPAGSSLVTPTGARDFDFRGLRRLAIAGENVPAGKYAIQAFERLGVWPSIRAKVIYGDNVRTVLRWVTAGEMPAGIVYATDAKTAGTKVRVLVHGFDGLHPEIRYAALIISGGPHQQHAKAFLDYLQSPEGMKITGAAGFGSLPGT